MNKLLSSRGGLAEQVRSWALESESRVLTLCLWVQGLSLRMGEGHPERQMLQLGVVAAPLLILSLCGSFSTGLQADFSTGSA